MSKKLWGGAHGPWPEGTPQVFIDLTNKITPEERLLHSIFGDKDSIEEILARPADYRAIKEEESRRRMEARGGKSLKEQVEDVLDSLTERERKVMYSRFGLNDGRSKTLAEVGQEIGRSRWTAGRIEKRALRKLRHPSRLQVLRD